jgi:hypothetical protein
MLSVTLRGVCRVGICIGARKFAYVLLLHNLSINGTSTSCAFRSPLTYDVRGRRIAEHAGQRFVTRRRRPSRRWP